MSETSIIIDQSTSCRFWVYKQGYSRRSSSSVHPSCPLRRPPLPTWSTPGASTCIPLAPSTRSAPVLCVDLVHQYAHGHCTRLDGCPGMPWGWRWCRRRLGGSPSYRRRPHTCNARRSDRRRRLTVGQGKKVRTEFLSLKITLIYITRSSLLYTLRHRAPASTSAPSQHHQPR